MSGSKSNVKFSVIPETLEPWFGELFPTYKEEGWVRGEPGGYVLPTAALDCLDEVYQLKPRPEDVWMMTFPKSGTTWISELVWLLKNNLDYEEASKSQILQRALYPEFLCYLPRDARVGMSQLPLTLSIQDMEKLPNPRVLRPHFTFELLHPDILDTAKVIYMARNPKDVIVSYFYYHRLMTVQEFKGDFDSFARLFMKDQILATPYFNHVLQAWNKRHHPNMHFVFYEDMKMDLRGEIKKVADFLGKPLTEDELSKLEKHLQFESIEKNKSVNQEMGKKIGLMKEDGGKFMRKGIIGDWKNHFSPELNKEVDDWIAKNLAGTDLKFVTE